VNDWLPGSRLRLGPVPPPRSRSPSQSRLCLARRLGLGGLLAPAGAEARGTSGPPGATAGDWPGWQKDLRGTRYNSAETDDASLVELDATGRVITVWPVSGDGREEITALSAAPGGFVAGIALTAAARPGSDA
jgi:hypothetical protein